jgi:hypothetical protein
MKVYIVSLYYYTTMPPLIKMVLMESVQVIQVVIALFSKSQWDAKNAKQVHVMLWILHYMDD